MKECEKKPLPQTPLSVRARMRTRVRGSGLRPFTVVIFNVAALTHARFGWFIALGKGETGNNGRGKNKKKKTIIYKSRARIVSAARAEDEREKLNWNPGPPRRPPTARAYAD